MTDQDRAAALAAEIERDDPVVLHHGTDRHALIVTALLLLAQTGGRVVCTNCGSSPPIGFYRCDCADCDPPRDGAFAAPIDATAARAAPPQYLREAMARAMARADGSKDPSALFAPPQTTNCPRDPRPAWAEWLGQVDAALTVILRDHVIMPRAPSDAAVMRAMRTASCHRPVGAGDGQTSVVLPPSKTSMRAALIEYAENGNG